MTISISELELRNFKSYKNVGFAFSEITRIIGTNGAGKSTIGEAITWACYGVDTLGNTLQKATSPAPTNYVYDRVEVHVLFTDGTKQTRVSRMIENGEMAYFINDVPKKATEFKTIVDMLFNCDKSLFLTLFNPLYFFTQKWDEQRAQLLQYVTPPAEKDVLKKLADIHRDLLTPLLKKSKLADIEAKHRDNKNRMDKQIPFLSGQVKAIRDDYSQAPETDKDAIEKLHAELALIDSQYKETLQRQTAQHEAIAKSHRFSSELDRIKNEINALAVKHKHTKQEPILEECNACKQPLTESAIESVKGSRQTELDAIKAKHAALKATWEEVQAASLLVDVIEFDPSEINDLQNKRHEIEVQISKLADSELLAAKLAAAEQQEKDAIDSLKESTLILEAVKSFKAEEADFMAGKIANLFPTLTLELTQKNADGTEKPFFEVYQDGKPFRKLSRAESIIAGLELVDVLTKQSGITVPLFLDNAESILSYKQPIGQLIECRVADQPLTILEVEN